MCLYFVILTEFKLTKIIGICSSFSYFLLLLFLLLLVLGRQFVNDLIQVFPRKLEVLLINMAFFVFLLVVLLFLCHLQSFLLIFLNTVMLSFLIAFFESFNKISDALYLPVPEFSHCLILISYFSH